MMRRIRRWSLLLAMALMAPLYAQEAPVLRVTAKAPAQGQTGATVRLQLEVMTSTWFTQPPRLPALDLPGVLVTPPSGEAELVRGNQDGQTFSGLRYTYLLSAQSAGTLRIPALAVTAQLGPGGAPVTAESAPLSIEFTGAAQPGKVVGDLTVTQSFNLAPDPMVQGGRITRSVTQRADGVQAMLLPPAPLADVPHFKRYPREPEVVTLTDGRGGFLGGQRIDRADYIAQEAGSYELPPLTLNWTDGPGGALQSKTLPGRRIDVAAAAQAAPPFSLADDLARLRHGLRWVLPPWAVPAIVAATAAGFALWLAWAWWMRLARAMGAAARAGRARWRASEPHYWFAWRREAHGAKPVLSDFYRWIRRGSGAVALREALAPMDEADRQLAESTLRRVYGAGEGNADWRARLAARSRAWRKAWRRRSAPPAALRAELNPVDQAGRNARVGRS